MCLVSARVTVVRTGPAPVAYRKNGRGPEMTYNPPAGLPWSSRGFGPVGCLTGTLHLRSAQRRR